MDARGVRPVVVMGDRSWSWVHIVLMAGMVGGLELERGMGDVEVLHQARLEGIEDLGRVARTEAMVLHDHVRSQGR